MERFLRTVKLLGNEAVDKLKDSRVVLAGLGAVGSFAAEALARSGVGSFVLVDFDTVHITNINRQIYALESTIGKKKTEVAKERILDINPKAEVIPLDMFIEGGALDRIFLHEPDLIIDAIDSLGPKADLLSQAVKRKIPVLSSMGAALKSDPAKIQTADLFQTSNCSLAKQIRRMLRKRGISEGVQCVYSSEPPKKEAITEVEKEKDRKGNRAMRKAQVLGSLNTITGIFGLTLAHEGLKILTEQQK
ncbi:MAG: ThiF family adenylyltransferase [Spirochaetia bacterium]